MFTDYGIYSSDNRRTKIIPINNTSQNVELLKNNWLNCNTKVQPLLL